MGDAEKSNAGSNSGLIFLTIDQADACNYYFGRLVWNNVATLRDIEDWVYSMDDLNRLHDMLDLRDKIEMRKEAAANG